MRTFVSIFLFLLFLTQVFSSAVMDGMYRLNYNYVAQTLCINKNKPALHCDGKCYLSKQIKKDAANEATPSGSKREKGETSFFLPSYYSLTPVAYSSEALTNTGFCQNLLPQHISLLLRPPCLFTA